MPAEQLYTLAQASKILGPTGGTKALTLEHAAEVCDTSVATIRRAIDRGELRKVYPGTVKPIVLVKDLDAWLASRSETPPQ